jgi:uncharacterized protein (DUF58 family)
MQIRVIPGRVSVVVLAGAGAAVLMALATGTPMATANAATVTCFASLVVAGLWDYTVSLRAWREASPKLTRRLPAAFALGTTKPVHIGITVEGSYAHHCELYDHADSSLLTNGLSTAMPLVGGKRTDSTYSVTPSRRGEVTFAPAEVRIKSRWGLCELRERLGGDEVRRVYPDFAQVARYAWLAGDRRLQEIGIKTYQKRGQGTDFKQLSEYRVGDSVRHMDWRATLRLGKPIVRQYQDERDQCVMLLVDCGRRMRADDRTMGIGTSHFDQVLNAIMLLSYVALKGGDAVGAMTFGTPVGQERTFAPRKGLRALNAMMGQLYDVEPTPTHSDYVTAAQALTRRLHKRALVIVITNFRDEDSTELSLALRLLRSRHLVMLASLRERIVGELMSQPVVSGDAAIDVASAHLYEQSRRDAFIRLAARDALMVDAPPERLGIELVNRYGAMKRAGTI